MDIVGKINKPQVHFSISALHLLLHVSDGGNLLSQVGLFYWIILWYKIKILWSTLK